MLEAIAPSSTESAGLDQPVAPMAARWTAVASGASEFQLELSPLKQVTKLDAAGAACDVDVVLSALCEHGTHALRLLPGECVMSPPVRLSSEHVVQVAAGVDEGCTGRLVVEREEPGAEGGWRALLSLDVDSTSIASLSLRLSRTVDSTRFRVRCDSASPAGCLLRLFRVGPQHRISRLNATADYAFRLQNEIGFFSGAAYTHSMYGASATAPAKGGGVVRRASARRSSAQHAAAMAGRAADRLARIRPRPDEVAFNYAHRALGEVLPTTPPDFFERAASMPADRTVRVLSICAGAARIEEQLLQRWKGEVDLTLLDASPDLIQRAADRLSATRPGVRVECLVGDVNRGLPGDGEYDVIVCVSALHHVAELELVFSQINEQLVADGEFWSIGEQIGRNGNRLWPEAYAAANEVFATLPVRLRYNAHTGEVDEALTDKDFSVGCFEGIRSEELEGLLDAYLIPEHVYKRNAFLWRLVNASYSDNFDMQSPEDLAHLRRLIGAEVVHWACGGRGTELHGVYRKKRVG
jgi:SAM-dependent methyltransferase